MEDLKEKAEPQGEDETAAQAQKPADSSAALSTYVDRSYGKLRPYQISDAFRDFIGSATGIGQAIRSGLVVFERWTRREQEQLASALRKTETLSGDIAKFRGELEEERVRNAALQGQLKSAKERTTTFALTSVLGAAVLSAGVSLCLKGMPEIGVPLIVIATLLLLLPFIMKLWLAKS